MYSNWSRTLPEEVIQHEWLDSEKGNSQIYLGLNGWAPESFGIPLLVASQKYGRDGEFQRVLAMFEVFAERGMKCHFTL